MTAEPYKRPSHTRRVDQMRLAVLPINQRWFARLKTFAQYDLELYVIKYRSRRYLSVSENHSDRLSFWDTPNSCAHVRKCLINVRLKLHLFHHKIKHPFILKIVRWKQTRRLVNFSLLSAHVVDSRATAKSVDSPTDGGTRKLTVAYIVVSRVTVTCRLWWLVK